MPLFSWKMPTFKKIIITYMNNDYGIKLKILQAQ
jgi:hypothetical protein